MENLPELLAMLSISSSPQASKFMLPTFYFGTSTCINASTRDMDEVFGGRMVPEDVAHWAGGVMG